MSNVVQLRTKGMQATIRPLGAQLMSLTAEDGLELLWYGDPAYWPERAPILFPLIGPLVDNVLRYRGATYEMPPHGFAQGKVFEVSGKSDDQCTFTLRDDAETRAIYPFAFRLEVSYQLQSDSILVTQRVTNTGTETLPADVGFHPGFRWPLTPGRAKEDYRIVFEQDEPAPIRRGAGDPILLYPEPFPTPVEGNILHLRDELFEAQAIVFDKVNSKSLTYGAGDGPKLRIEFPDSPNLAVWMRPGAPFVAIEPWQGYPAELGYQGDFTDKPGIVRIPPGESQHWRLGITFDSNAERTGF